MTGMTGDSRAGSTNAAGIAHNPGRVGERLEALGAYRLARQRLLSVLDLAASNRDPLAEFSEQFVAALLGGRLAASRVQAGYDITTPTGQTVQVRYLANTGAAWVNEHQVMGLPGADLYALVIFEGFATVAVLLFPQQLAPICTALGKRHPAQNTTLQFTRRNLMTIRDDPARFTALGMQVWFPPFSGRRQHTTE